MRLRHGPALPSKLIDLIERYQLDNLDKGVDVSYASKGDALARPPANRHTVHATAMTRQYGDHR